MEGSASEALPGGNLGLCQVNKCLDTSPSGEGIVQSRLNEDAILSWRFEDGLLRAVDAYGNATDRCLGPSVTTLDSNHETPYRLVLQDCPESEHEKIFSHDDAEDAATSTMELVDEKPVDDGRHMRFVIVGDGRIQSLARVDEQTTLENSAFCISDMNFGTIGEPNAYLVPCLDDREEQLFNIDAGSSFEPYLLHFQSEDEKMAEFAYQLGYDGSISSFNPEGFESFAIKVTCDCDSAFIAEGTLPTQTSGTLSFALSDFEVPGNKVHGRLEAHLLGISRGGLESKWLATTSFFVGGGDGIAVDSITDDDGIAKGRIPATVKTLFCFLGFMVFYCLLVKASSIFCPANMTRQRRMLREKLEKKEKRDSEITSATMEEAANRVAVEVPNESWGRTSMESNHSNHTNHNSSAHSRSTLFRITEDLDPEDIEDFASIDDGEQVFSDAGNTVTNTTADSEDYQAVMFDCDIETSQ